MKLSKRKAKSTEKRLYDNFMNKQRYCRFIFAQKKTVYDNTDKATPYPR